MNREIAYDLKKDRFSSHSQISKLIVKDSRIANSHPYIIWDIGCSVGFLRYFLREDNFYLVGLEREHSAAQVAKKTYNHVIECDFSSNTLIPLDSLPNMIVLGDILEHLAEPKKVLTEFLRCNSIPSGTRIIISLPNIAHIVIRLCLMIGYFEYSDKGILDRTHLRFFTMRSALKLCEECNIKLVSVRTTPVPLPLIHPVFGDGHILFFLHRFNALLSNMFKSLLGYQFILEGIYES